MNQLLNKSLIMICMTLASFNVNAGNVCQTAARHYVDKELQMRNDKDRADYEKEKAKAEKENKLQEFYDQYGEEFVEQVDISTVDVLKDPEGKDTDFLKNFAITWTENEECIGGATIVVEIKKNKCVVNEKNSSFFSADCG